MSAKETLYGDQFTLSAELINLIILKYPHRRSPAVSLETPPPLYPSDAFLYKLLCVNYELIYSDSELRSQLTPKYT